MITFSKIKSNYSFNQPFKSKETKQNNTNNQRNNNISSKVKTGTMLTTALLAGIGIGTTLPKSSNQLENNNIKTEEVITKNSNDEKSNNISYEEFIEERNKPEKVYIYRDTIKNNNIPVKIKESYYAIKPREFLTSEIVRDINTGNIIKKGEYSNYTFLPKKQVIQDFTNNTKWETRINDFDYDMNTAKSTDKLVYYSDGRKDSTHISNPVFRFENFFIDPKSQNVELEPEKTESKSEKTKTKQQKTESNQNTELTDEEILLIELLGY